MNMCNVTFEVPRLSTLMFKKSLEKNIFTIIFVVKSLKGFGWNNVGPASQTVANINSQLGQSIVLSGQWLSGHKTSPVWQSEQTRDNHPILFQCWTSIEYD